MTDPFAVEVEACRRRQQRLAAELEQLGLEAAILTRPESVQWLTGTYVAPHFTSAAVFVVGGEVTLAVPEHMAEMQLAADRIVPYAAQRLCTLRDDQRQACWQALVEASPLRAQRMGGEFAFLGRSVTEIGDVYWTDIEEVLLRLRRRKDADELRMLARANVANRAMYEYARRSIEPGMDELQVYNGLQSVATRELGEALTYFGQDFQCNSPGGPPRYRQVNAGELYILDLGVGFRGFRSDNCRTFAVSNQPDERQQRAWQAIVGVFDRVQSYVKPGASCKQLFNDVLEYLSAYQPWEFFHHLGHGVGYAGHEAPRLNPNWDDYFEEGDFFTVEPGLYHEQLRGGIRLEQNYVVTHDGVQLMTDWPLQL